MGVGRHGVNHVQDDFRLSGRDSADYYWNTNVHEHYCQSAYEKGHSRVPFFNLCSTVLNFTFDCIIVALRAVAMIRRYI